MSLNLGQPSLRKRVNVSQSTKGIHTIEVTLEISNALTATPEDLAKLTVIDMSDEILKTIQTMEKKLKDDKRILAKDGGD